MSDGNLRRKRHSPRVRRLENLEKRNLLFAPIEQVTLLDGLESLSDTLDRVETHAEYAQQIPGLETTAGAVADVSELVRDGLIEPLESVLDGVTEVPVDDVVAALDGFSQDAGDVVTTLRDLVATETDTSSEAKVTLTATIQQSRSLQQQLGGFGDAEWIGWSGDAPVVDVVASTEATVSFGVDLISQEFFVNVGEVTSDVTANADAISAELSVGPVDASVSAGDFKINGTVTTDFGDLVLSKDDLEGALTSLVSVAADGSLDVTLPVTYSLGTYSGSETITWEDNAALDGEFTVPELSSAGGLIDAIRVDSEDLAGFFTLIGTKLDELLDGGLPNWSDDFLPWLEGLKLPDLSNFSDQFTDFSNDQLKDEEGRTNFRTFEELRERIAQWTNRDTLLSYLPSTSELTYEFEIPVTINRPAIAMGVSEDYDPLAGIDVTGTATATGEMVITGTFGVDLTELLEDTTPEDMTDNDSWADHFYVDDLQLTAMVDAATESASASARLGFVSVAVGSIAMEADAHASLEFADPNAADGRITFKRLSEFVVTDPTQVVADSSLSGSAEVTLSEMTVDGILGLNLEDGEIEIGFTDITDPSSFDFAINESVRNINALSSVTTEDWVELAGNVISMLDDLTASAKWDESLPGVGKSVNDLLDVASKLQQAAEDLLEADENTIQALGEKLETLLEDALSLDPSMLDVVLSWQSDSLEMEVQFTASTNLQTSLSVDVADLITHSSDNTTAFDLVGEIVDVSGESALDVAASLEGTLVFGVDVGELIAETDGATPEFYVGEETGFLAELDVRATDIDAGVAIGPLGLFIVDGTVTIDADGDAGTTGPAEFSAKLADVADDRYTVAGVTNLKESDVEFTFDAGASIVLPLYFPTVSDPVGGSTVDDANAIVAGIGNIRGLFNSEDPQVTLSAPDLDSLIDDFDPLDEGVRALADGLEALLLKIEELLREKVLNQNLPMVGNKLEEAADFLREVREDAIPILRDRLVPLQLVDEIKLVLFDALGSVMKLNDVNSDSTIDHLDVDLTLDATAGTVDLNLSLGDTYTVGADIDFDLGLPALGLDLDGGVEASLEWAIDFGVGINPTDGFFVDTSDANEIELSAEVTLPDAELQGTLGLFQITVADQGSRLAADFDLDLKEPSGDGKLTFAEITSGEAPVGDLVESSLTGGANVDLSLVAGTNYVSLPELHADFVLDWNFDGSNQAGNIDRLAIENIELDLGTFISGFAGDILREVQKVLKPIEPIVEILTAPLPVANDLDFLVDAFAAETTPRDAVNLLDFAFVFGENFDVDMLDAIVQIVDLVNSIPVPAAGESVMIPLGEVVIIDGSTGSRDPDNVDTDSVTVNDKDLSDELSNYSGSEEQERFAQESASFIEKMSQVKGGGFQFPILQNPASLIGVFLGQDATLFAYQTPKLVADFSLGITVPITGPFAIEFVGGIGVDAQFAFGYDTLGLRNFIDTRDVADLADGFFVSDRENVDGTGSDIAEVNLKGSLEAFATITAGVGSVSVGGGIHATVGANLRDNDHDGKVRLQEIAENFPLCIFDFAGSLSAGLRAKAQVLGVPFSQDIATIRLLEFSAGCVDPGTDLSLGEVDENGIFRMFVGPDAGKREVGEGIVDEYATFSKTIDESGNDALEVSAFGITEVVTGATGVYASGGDGNDAFIVVGDLDIPVQFFGGQGDDELVGGSGDDILFGGGGDDLIQGGEGADSISGGSGNDVLDGGDGSDEISGGDRNDYITGGAGNDFIEGEHGNDIIFGGQGADTILGGDFADEIYGNHGDDIIQGGDGDDVIEGGAGADSIEGNEGDDKLFGNSGDDFVHGGRGNDEVYGHNDDDILYGGFGLDFISGGFGRDVAFGGNERIADGHDNSADRILGDGDNDFLIGDDGEIIDFDGTFYIINVLGGAGDDIIEGGDGADWAHGVGGRDQIFGGIENDHLIGGDDADEIFGQDGHDWLEGGDGDDIIEGHAGGDTIGGGRGADLIDGGEDADSLYSHGNLGAEPWHVSHVETPDDAAADIIFGRSGPDEIVGGFGDDYIDAGAGDDAVLPGLGNDTIAGGLGDDYIEANVGRDQVLGQWGDDEILIGQGNFMRLDAQHGGKALSASNFSNDSKNKVTIGSDRVTLDLADPTVASQLTDVDRIDGSRMQEFTVSITPKAVTEITDDANTLRLDINAFANATLEGEWTEQAGELIDGEAYRRLTFGDITLLVTDLKPHQRDGDSKDVDGNGEITPLDALLVINHLSAGGSLISELSPIDGNKVDVTGDNQVTPFDALSVINELAARARQSLSQPERVQRPGTPVSFLSSATREEVDRDTEEAVVTIF